MALASRDIEWLTVGRRLPEVGDGNRIRQAQPMLTEAKPESRSRCKRPYLVSVTMEPM
jgi:hypothetical protein